MQDSMTEIPVMYQGQFGEFTITDDDRKGVFIYRSALMVAALSFAIATTFVLRQPDSEVVQHAISALYTVFTLALGVSLLTIHIYMVALHRALQAFWVVGTVAAIAISHFYPEPFAVTVYEHPFTMLGVGFTFAALTGIFFKEAFCFNRLETKVLTPIVPFLLVGHMVGFLPPLAEQILLSVWAMLMLVFAVRKAFQDIPADIGDKSVFDYLHQKHS